MIVITSHELGRRVHVVVVDPRNGRYLVGMNPTAVCAPLLRLYRAGRSGRWVDDAGHEWEPIVDGDDIRWRHAEGCVCSGVRPL